MTSAIDILKSGAGALVQKGGDIANNLIDNSKLP
jgi:hypothetical protein